MEEKLGTQVYIKHIDLGFLNRLILDDVLIYDQKGKKMLKASRISVKFDYLSLSQGRISISSAQIFGLKADLYKETERAATNFQFLLDSLASKDTTQHTPIDLHIHSLIVRNGSVKYDRWDMPRSRTFTLNHVAAMNISGHFILDVLTNDSLNLSIKKLAFNETSGLSVKSLSLKFIANKTSALLDGFHLCLPRTEIKIDKVQANYRWMDGKLSIPTLQYKAILKESKVTPADFTFLSDTFHSFITPVYISAALSGTGSSLHSPFLNIYSRNKQINLRANGSISNWETTPRWFASISELNMSAESIRFITKNLNGKAIELPPHLTRLGNVHFIGNIGGIGKAITTSGVLRTDAGKASISLSLKGKEFESRLHTEDLNLKRILADNKFGSLSTNILINGVLRSSGIPDLTAKGNISKIDYNSHTYRNIHIDGTYQKGTFSGVLSLDDTHGNIHLSGQCNLSAPVPSANMKLAVSEFNPHALQLTDKYKDTKFRFNLAADFKGKSLNLAEGQLVLHDFSMESPTKTYQFATLTVKAGYENKEHFVQINSDFGNADLRGHYDFTTLVQSFTNLVGSKLPTLPGLPKQTRSRNNNFSITANIENTEWLQQLFDIPLTLHQPAHIKGKMSDKEKKLDMTLSMPQFSYKGNDFEQGFIDIKTPNDTLKTDIRLNRMESTGHRFAYDVQLSAIGNKLKSVINWDNRRQQSFKGQLNAETQFFMNAESQPAAHTNVHISHVWIGDTVWQIQPSDIVYSKDRLIIDHFSIEHNKQHIIVSGNATSNAADSVTIDLQDVDVNYILNLINFHAVEFSGLASGRAVIASVLDSPEARANLKVKNFCFENGHMGTLDAHVTWNNTQEQIDINAVADDPAAAGSTIIQGYVSPKRDYIDLGITAQHTRLEFLQSLCGSFMQNVDAHADGQVRLFGPLSHINLTGELMADGTIGIKPLNTVYTLSQSVVRMRPNEIEFPQDTIRDRNGNIGIVEGILHHRNLTRLSYDLNIHTQNLLAYDFKDNGTQTFYGTVYATGDCAIHGGSGETTIDVSMTPERGSFLEYDADAAANIGEQGFIHWKTLQPTILTNETFSLQPNNAAVSPSTEPEDIPTDIRLNLLINCTPTATLRVLMDRQSGDYIALNGTGTLRASYYNKGTFDMFGNYAIDHGIYKLTIQNVIKKDFHFQEGSTIVFGGDPYNAALNLTALYTVSGVSLSDLNIGRSFAKNTIRVNCIMNISGTPKTPLIDFNLDLPAVNTDVKQMVYSIINSEEEMNQQVLYLLSIGRFYTQGNNNADEKATQQSQTSLAMQSILSGTLSQQLNNVLSSVINNSTSNFGALISTGDEGWNNAEYEGMLSGRLLNNRLLVNGQFGYRDNPNATTGFMGDFDLRYLIYPNGNLAIKVYNKTNDRYFTRNSLNTQGLGIIWKKDFNTLRDLFGASRKTNKKTDKKKKQETKKKRSKH